MELKLFLEILFFAVSLGVPFSMILAHKDIQIRELKRRIDTTRDFIDEHACKNCPGIMDYCGSCNFNEVLTLLKYGKNTCQFLKKQEENKGNVDAD